MVLFPKASDHNIPPGPNDPPIDPRIIVVHTMDGTIEGAEDRFHDGSGVESHFGVAMDGRVWQWRDTDREADAQSAGNPFCISIETEDGGDPARRWTPVQFQRLVELIGWLGERHAIPMRLVSRTGDRGIAFHRQFPEWNPDNHSCPGDVRLGQLRSELLPALEKEDLDMATSDEIMAALKGLRQDLTVQGTHGLEETVEHFATRQRQALSKLGDLERKVGELEAKVDAVIAGLAPPRRDPPPGT